MGGDTGGFLQLDGGMFSGQLQQALHHAQALWPTVLLHRFSPSACERSDQAATVQQVVGTPFDDVAFAAVQMSGIGGELSWFRQRVQSDLFSARVVKAQEP